MEPLHILDNWTPSELFGMHPRCASGAGPSCRPPVGADCGRARRTAPPTATARRVDGARALASRGDAANKTGMKTGQRPRFIFYFVSTNTVDGRVCACAGRVCPRVSEECVLSVRAREDGGGKGGGREAVAEGLKGRGEAEGRRRVGRPVSVPQASTFYGRRRTGRTRSPWSPA